MASALWPRSGDRQLSNAGRIMPGAKAYFYDATTTTPQTVYSDYTRLSSRSQPVTADAYGKWPAVYIAPGSYRYRIYDSADALIDDFDGIIAPDDPSTVTGTSVTISAFWETVLDELDAAASLTGLGLSANAQTFVTAANYAAMRTALAVYSTTQADTAFQPKDSDLTAIAALTTTTYGRALLALADEAAFKAAVNAEAGVDFLAIVPSTGVMPVGYCNYMRYTSNTALTDGSTTAGTNVTTWVAHGAGFTYPSPGTVQTGTWKNVSGNTLDNDGSEQIGMMVRTA